MDSTQNIELFRELVTCGEEISLWIYDREGNLISSNCPSEAIFDTAFSASGCRTRMLSYAALQNAPVLLGTEAGLVWGAAFEKQDGALLRACVLGPVLFSEAAMRQIKAALASWQDTNVSIAWKARFTQLLPSIPVSQHVIFSRYILMLHYCLTGSHLKASDLHILSGSSLKGSVTPPPQSCQDRYSIWKSELALLRMVRDGDLDYAAAFHASSMLSNGVPLTEGAPLRQEKNSVIVFCSIVCRAAMDGGLPPEEAYSLGDAYIQNAEHAKTMDDLSAIAVMMYDDFVRRVHRCRTNPSHSETVQKCCDYIERNLHKKVSAAELAELAGYSEYYITRKFKAETGYFINDYIKFTKTERAKMLLQCTDLTISDISLQLGFATRNYFSQVFRSVTGLTPSEFRERKH